jgi:hypothetical protein
MSGLPWEWQVSGADHKLCQNVLLREAEGVIIAGDIFLLNSFPCVQKFCESWLLGRESAKVSDGLFSQEVGRDFGPRIAICSTYDA